MSKFTFAMDNAAQVAVLENKWGRTKGNQIFRINIAIWATAMTSTILTLKKKKKMKWDL